MQTSVTLRATEFSKALCSYRALHTTIFYSILQSTTDFSQETRLQRTTRYDKALQRSIQEESAALETLKNSSVTDQDNGEVTTLFSPNSHGGMKQMTQGPGVHQA